MVRIVIRVSISDRGHYRIIQTGYAQQKKRCYLPQSCVRLIKLKIIIIIIIIIRNRKANWIGHILRRNCLLKQVIEVKIKGEMDVTRNEEEDVGSCWMTLRTGEDTLI
jgi:hypothetical protein